MTINDTPIEKALKSLLQKDVKFLINNKQFKRGKFILFKQNNYHIEITIDKDGDYKRFELPIPFNIELWVDEGLIYFDYRFLTLSNNDIGLHDLIKSFSRVGNNRFYDKILEIEVNGGI